MILQLYHELRTTLCGGVEYTALLLLPLLMVEGSPHNYLSYLLSRSSEGLPLGCDNMMYGMGATNHSCLFLLSRYASNRHCLHIFQHWSCVMTAAEFQAWRPRSLSTHDIVTLEVSNKSRRWSTFAAHVTNLFSHRALSLAAGIAAARLELVIASLLPQQHHHLESLF